MRKAVMTASMPPVDNRRGKKRDTDGVAVQPDNNDADRALYARTLEHLLETEAVEKEEKQQNSLRVRLVRDKIVSRRGKREMLLQQLNFMSKKKPDEKCWIG